MSMFMQALFEGIINGSTLALVAMGIALVWGVMGILSFTQGEFLMIAMFCSFYLNLYFGLDPIVSLPICMAIMFGIGFIVYKLIIARALRGPVLSQRLITFALSMVLVNLALLLFSGDFKIAGAAGCALTYFYYIYPNVGANFQLFGFIAVVMGGFGSIPGAFFGGLIMGLADSFTGVYMNTAFKYVGICVVFLLLVQFKPKGLFGGK